MYSEYEIEIANLPPAKISLNKDRKEIILSATSWMDVIYKDPPISIRCAAILLGYDKDSIPKCPVCGNPVSYDKAYLKTFSKFCSNACARSVGDIPIDSYFKLIDRDWLYDKRITKKMSYTSIGELLGVTHICIKNYCKKHDIPEVKYNESDSMVALKLNDPVLLTTLYAEGRTMEEIADILGSSKATVSLKFAEFDITPRNPNSYDRKFNKRSEAEISMESYINSLGVITEHSRRTLIPPYEIDIFVPSMKIGFEYNGCYSHNEDNKGEKYHLMKTTMAKEKGIRLIHIFEDSWLLKREITESVIAAKLGVFKEKVFARKCEVVSITVNEKKEFLESSHMQGNCSGSIRYGLKCDGEIVAVMTFGKSRYNKKYEWELTRFACKKHTNVVGGFTKLLSHFRKNNSGSIISYADRCLSDGGVYANNGFELVRTNPPNYWYIEKNRILRLHRSGFIKGKIADDGDMRSEKEIMLDKGYTRIWDCGTYAFGMN